MIPDDLAPGPDVVPSPYVRRLPIGQRLPVREDGLPSWSIFPYEGDLKVRPLDAPELPEPPRQGEAGAGECDQCARPDSAFLWTDANWRLGVPDEPAGLPATVLLEPRAHHDLADLPVERAAELGLMVQRTERALLSIGGVGRVHVARWGDGAAHLHLWLLARPAGMMQLRGACLPLWNDLLPKVAADEWARTGALIAAAMAAGGGTAHV